MFQVGFSIVHGYDFCATGLEDGCDTRHSARVFVYLQHGLNGSREDGQAGFDGLPCSRAACSSDAVCATLNDGPFAGKRGIPHLCYVFPCSISA